MRRKYTLVLALTLAVAAAASCAVDPDEDTNYSYDRVMSAWMRINYPHVKPFNSQGAYLLEMEQGTGTSVSSEAYVRAHYTKRMLDGTIVSTNEQPLAEQLGSYAVSTWYGGNTWHLGQGYLPDALEDVLKTLKTGSRVKVALPLSASSHESSCYSAFTSTSESNNFLYDLTIDEVISDITDYQEKAMRSWFNEHYACTDTIVEHLYFKKLVEQKAESDTIPEGNTVNVRYIGRMLNGQVFDTNIEDTAKFYRIWKSSGSYDALEFSYYKDDDDQYSSNNSVVEGFGRSLLHMNYGETAVALFISDLGYGEKGSSPSIPEYAPLFFWLYIEPKN